MMGNYSIGAHADGRDDNGKWLRWGPELAKLRSRTFPGIAIDLESRETAIGHCITVDYWCYADEIRMALTTFPEEETLHGKFELARGKKKIKFREEAEKEEAEKNAFAKALKECLENLASGKSQIRGESVIKLRMTPEKVMQVFRICPACGNPYAGNRYCDRCGQRLEW